MMEDEDELVDALAVAFGGADDLCADERPGMRVNACREVAAVGVLGPSAARCEPLARFFSVE